MKKKKKKASRKARGNVVYVTRGSPRIKKGQPGCRRKVLGINLGGDKQVRVRLLEDDHHDTVGWNLRGQVGVWGESAISKTRRARVTARAEIKQGEWWFIDTPDEVFYAPKRDLGSRPDEPQVMEYVGLTDPEELLEWKLIRGYGARVVFTKGPPTPWQVFHDEASCRQHLSEVYCRCLICAGELNEHSVCPACTKNLDKTALRSALRSLIENMRAEDLLEISGVEETVLEHYRNEVTREIYYQMLDDESTRVTQHAQRRNDRSKKT
jgi:hypothetical protein